MTNENNGNAISSDEILGYAQMAETGDYGADCATGRLMADALIKRMADTDGTPALGRLVSEMVKAGRWGAVHIGFFQRLADRSVQELA
ncbi:hypothetical protein ASE82_10960 [Sphingomonas sp. Leaf230]|uniref:hypothetical protein n=1 Tax=Sphingomonas sp. Leaf230 TaxID=1735694 RepID=UPI0006FDBE6F|nr:hypothetical protein [Sphingomonas sp. Leaf230]KQN02796.1 hypothetical protein ASE82_10960 [Sphingomonas sp. Leaf230]